MDKIACISSKERAELFSETALRMGVNPAVVEKDFWVCWVLKRLFEDDSLSGKILFKGGTSLSKVFGIIERFSEDIDLILNWDEITNENPHAQRSRSQQDKFNKSMLERGARYLDETLKPQIQALVADVCQVSVGQGIPDAIYIRYPASYAESYLRPEICLEIGPLALWCPNAEYAIMPYAAREFPAIFRAPVCKVKAVIAERTFWEKATILHHEANRPQDNPQPSRYSRHYYDMACMAQSPVRDKALARLDLLESVVQFKDKFYPRGWARYDLAVPGTLRLIPNQKLLDELKKDYRQMQIMIFGDVPAFESIIQTLTELESQINSLQSGK